MDFFNRVMYRKNMDTFKIKKSHNLKIKLHFNTIIQTAYFELNIFFNIDH